jgi:uncharacterized protein
MSQENVRIVEGCYQAFATGNIPAVIAAMDPQIEWREAENFIYADRSPYIGPDAVLNGVFARLGSEWSGFGVSAEEILDAGDTIVGRGRYTGTFLATGIAVNAQFVHVFKLRAGKIVQFQQYCDTAQIRDAVSRRASA